jgi:hypothetical protein
VSDPVLVLDEHLMALRPGLELRGIAARTVRDLGVTSTLDPDVIRAVARDMRARLWVLITMDGTIVEEHRNFEWERYAIAWIVIERHLSGIAVEHAKTDVVQRHAHRMLEQRPGDHHTYTRQQRFRSPPSLVTTLRRSDPFGRRWHTGP